jgi:hypothetical protein
MFFLVRLGTRPAQDFWHSVGILAASPHDEFHVAADASL